MNKLFFIIIVAMFATSALSSDTLEDKVLAKVGNEKITYEKLESAFQKNMSGEKKKLYDLEKDSLEQFLNLFIDYRLKVMDAIDRGFDKEDEVINEIEDNKKLLTESYYYDTKVFQPNVNKIVDRRQYYFKFAYIMFPYDQTEGGKSDNSIKLKAQNVLDSIKSNKIDYVEAAKIYSADPKTAENGGVVDKFLISGTVQRPIENQLFELGVNQVSPELLETSYGFFILRLVEKLPRKQILASHILIKREGDEITQKESQRADSLLKLLKEGADFTNLAEMNSDDAASAINGGQLGEYYDLATGFVGSEGFLDNHFIRVLTNLKDGEFSDTIHTQYGIHIIKRIDSKSPDRDKDLDDVKDIYKRLYYEDDKQKYYEKYIYDKGFEINKPVFSKFLESINSNQTNLDSNWTANIPNDIYNENLFTYNNYSKSVEEFIELLSNKSNTEYRATPLNSEGLKSTMYKIIKPIVTKQWSDDLMTENKDFRNLIQEFHDGILLFKVEALEVWDKLQLDTAMAEQYFNSSNKKFMTNEKYDISEIFVLQDSLAQELYNRAKKGEDFAELATKFTQRQGYKERAGNHGLLDAEDNKFSRILKDEKIYEGAILEPETNGRGLSILKINSIEKPREMSFEEAIPVIAPAVQQIKQKQLVKNWLKDVRDKHKVTINQNTIDEIYEEYHK